MSNRVIVTGWCPFLLCLAPSPHAHPVCPACGVVRYGNSACDTCRVERQKFIDRGDLAILVPLEGPIA